MSELIYNEEYIEEAVRRQFCADNDFVNHEDVIVSINISGWPVITARAIVSWEDNVMRDEQQKV